MSSPASASTARAAAAATANALPPAGFWPRYVAWSLDAVIVAVLTSLIGASHWYHLAAVAREAYAAMNARMAQIMSASVLGDMDFVGFSRDLIADPALQAAGQTTVSAISGLILGWIALYALCGLIYELGFVALSSWRATPGKRALGLQVVDMAGRRLGVGAAVVRYLGGGLSWLTLNIGHVMAMAKPEHRALHDRMAGARVVRTGEAGMPLWGWAWLVLQVIATLVACVWLMHAMQGAMDAAMYQSGAL
ncbi:MAG: RDD family protein [Lysobacter sp.]